MSSDKTKEQPSEASPSSSSSHSEAEAVRISLDLLPEPAIIFARDGTILEANPSALRQLEADTPDQLVGRSVYSLDLHHTVREAIGHTVRGEQIHFEMDLVTLKGNQRRFDILAIPLLTPAGEVERVLTLGRDVTGQRETERAREFLAAIVSSSDDAIATISPDLRIMSWNRGAQDLLGFTAEEAIGQSPDIHIPPEKRAEAHAFMAHDLPLVRQQRAVRRAEVTLQRKDGSLIDVSMVVSGVYDSTGKVLGMSAIYRDITERKRAERERALLAAIVESSDDVITSISPDLRITSWNPATQRLFGFTADEAIGQPFTLYIPPERHTDAEAVVGQLRAHPDRVIRLEAPCQRKDGAPVDVSMTIFAIRDSSGQLLGMAAVHRDITERKRAERQQALLAATVECSNDAIVSISSDLRITSWNRSAEKLFGFTAHEAVGQPFTLHIPPEWHTYANELARQLAVDPDRVSSFEAPCQRKDGSLIDISMVCFGIRDPSGQLLGMAAILHDITERKRAERQQALLAAIVESSEDAIISKALDYTISTWNAGAEKLYGYSAQEAIGKPVTMLIPSDRLDELEKVIGKALRGENIYQYETRRVCKDGRLLDVSLSESPVRDAAGRIVGVAAIERNISERLHTRELESQLASIVKFSGDAIVSLGQGAVVQSWNPGAERLFGYSAEELIGKPCPAIPLEKQEEAAELLRRIFDGEARWEVETKAQRKDGSCLDVALIGSPIFDRTGAVTGAAITVRDVTEHKRSEQALIAAQTELRARLRQQAVIARLGQRALGKVEPVTLMDEAVALVAETLSADTCAILQLQPDGASLLLRAGVGWKEGLVGRATVDGGNESQAGYTLSSQEPAIVRDFRTETRFRREPLLDEHGAVSGLSVVVHDQELPYGVMAVYTRARREFTRNDVNFAEAVAHIIAETVGRQRFERELSAARDAAVESARAKSAFLASMSHEIRTPLNSIVGLTGLLLDTELTAEQREFLENVRISSDILLDTVNNVLDFSKMSASKLTFENIEFDIRRIIESSVDMLAQAAQKKSIELVLAVDAKVPVALRGDPGRLRQALTNLLSNAVKFTEHGEVLVKVMLESETQNNAVVRFEVTDTGIGIPEEAQGRLFEPFYQVDSSITRRFGGTGLGLPIAAQLVRRMGGAIGVKSRKGEGSTFWFTVPLEKSTVPLSNESTRELEGLRVLIADDNATNRQIVRRQMESWGMRVDAAASGAEALTMMRKEAGGDPYVIALLDLQMPEMDGLELANQIKADPAISTIQLVMMSSSGERREFGPRAGALQAWLTKPVKSSQLLRCLASLPRPDDEKSKRQGAGMQPEVSPIQPRAEAATIKPREGRILVVEDNIINQKVAMAQLKRLGYKADGVADGREALAAMESVPYDLVLMDCQMPEMDGYEATRVLRRREAGARHTIVIAMTAFGLQGDREKCLAAGMDDYLAKPIRMEQLEEALDRWLGSNSTSVPAPEAPPAAGNPVGNPIFDPRIFLDLRKEGKELFAELVGMFNTEVPRQLDGIVQALAKGDTKTAAMLAHTLKGTAATFGANRMQEQAAEISQASRAGLVEKATAMLERFGPECDRVRSALEAEMKHSSASPGTGLI